MYLVLNNDRNERLKLKINNEIVWKNDDVPVCGKVRGDALVKGLELRDEKWSGLCGGIWTASLAVAVAVVLKR